MRLFLVILGVVLFLYAATFYIFSAGNDRAVAYCFTVFWSFVGAAAIRSALTGHSASGRQMNHQQDVQKRSFGFTVIRVCSGFLGGIIGIYCFLVCYAIIISAHAASSAFGVILFIGLAVVYGLVSFALLYFAIVGGLTVHR